MKMRMFLAGAVCAIVFIGVTTEVFSQGQSDQPKMPSADEQAKMMEAWMKLATPGEPHKQLEPLIGEWEVTTKMFMGGPGAPPMESKTTASVKWVCGGRFAMEEVKGTMMGQPFEGLGLTGYDNYQNMYVSSWIDNMGTSLTTFRGVRNPQTGVFTYYGQMDEPTMKVNGRTVKSVIRIIDKDKHIFEMYDLHAGDDYKVMEITYTRKE